MFDVLRYVNRLTFTALKLEIFGNRVPYYNIEIIFNGHLMRNLGFPLQHLSSKEPRTRA